MGVKKLLKADKLSAGEKASLNIRQLALKLAANSMYGCLGFSYSRFFAKPLAALVTCKGREILLQTRDLIQKMNLDVIYGDTDSVMVNTNSNDYEEVFRLGREIKQTVNKLYKLLELDIDGVYRYMLLLKKKKYAAVMVERDDSTGKLLETTELKGLDIVRRDWSQLAADAGRKVISLIMCDSSEDVRLAAIQEHLEAIKVQLLEGKVALKDLAITKSLTKDPADYADKKALPHVQVAMRMNSSGGKKLKAGDTAQYVICEDGSGLSATQRAYHVDEVKASETLKIDTQYYLSQQLHPVVSRLTEPIEGMEGARVAACLGLDPGCSGRTRCLPLQFQRAFPVCPVCRKATMFTEVSPTALYTQLQYLQHMLDLPKMRDRAEEPNEFRNNLHLLKGVESQYSMLKERLEAKYLRNSAYATVMLSKLFEGLPREDLRANKKGDRNNSLVAASA